MIEEIIKSQTRILDTNATWHGIKVSELMENAGKGIAEKIIELFGNQKNISVIAGLGNNGGDGIVAAGYLAKMTSKKITLYLIGRESELKKIPKEKFKDLNSKKPENLIIKQDAYAKDINEDGILVEALVGTGTSKKSNELLYKRFADVVSKLNHLKGKKIAIDVPAPKFKPDITISLHFPKVKDAIVVDIGIPKEIDQFCGPGEVRELSIPEKETYKTKTGELFVFGGSTTFHGAPMMAILGASKFIGSVYFYTTPENREITKKIKEEVYEFISVNENDIEKYTQYSDALLIGPGLEDNILNRSVIKKLFELFPDKPKVIDAYAIAMAPKGKLKNCIITPHRGELRHIWGEQTNLQTKRLEGNLRRFAVENECIIILKGHIDMLFNKDGTVMFNKTGNPGMAKGGTGDVFSGILGGFLTKNDPWLAARAAIFVSGFAGDLAYNEFGYNYSATDIVPFIQKAVKMCNDFNPENE